MLALLLAAAVAAAQPVEGWEVTEMRGNGLSTAGAATIQRELDASRAAAPLLLRQLDAARRERVKAWTAPTPDPAQVAAAQTGFLTAAQRFAEGEVGAVDAIFAALSPADRRIYGAWLAKYEGLAASAGD